MKKGTVFRKPTDDDYSLKQRIVHAKPIDERIVKKLGSLGAGKDFVVGSKQSQDQLAGGRPGSDSTSQEGSSANVLSIDERNKIEAKILKAEIKGNKELVEKLRRKLAGAQSEPSTDKEENVRILMKTDRRTGLTIPASRNDGRPRTAKTEDGRHNLGSVESMYFTERSVHEMAASERTTSAEDQLTLFGRAAKSADRKTDDDWVVDDLLLSHKRRRKQEEKDEQKKERKLIKENRAEERLLDSCAKCIDSPRLFKNCIVAVGIKTYLTVTSWKPLVNGQSLIVPMSHYPCSVSLDEDVYDELRIWRKLVFWGLVAMWKAEEMDCVFIEMAKNVKHRGHMSVECIPIPIEVGEMAPIYFKKAIDECESEWVDNKKLVDLGKKGGDVRKAIPKGFSYFAIDFGLQAGYAHVIEEEDRFPSYFAHEIIGGMLDLDSKLWRKIERLSTEAQMANAKALKEKWMPFDWTERVKKSISENNDV